MQILQKAKEGSKFSVFLSEMASISIGTTTVTGLGIKLDEIVCSVDEDLDISWIGFLVLVKKQFLPLHLQP